VPAYIMFLVTLESVCSLHCRCIRLHALLQHGLSHCVGEGVIEGPVLISRARPRGNRGEKGRRKGSEDKGIGKRRTRRRLVGRRRRKRGWACFCVAWWGGGIPGRLCSRGGA